MIVLCGREALPSCDAPKYGRNYRLLGSRANEILWEMGGCSSTGAYLNNILVRLDVKSKQIHYCYDVQSELGESLVAAARTLSSPIETITEDEWRLKSNLQLKVSKKRVSDEGSKFYSFSSELLSNGKKVWTMSAEAATELLTKKAYKFIGDEVYYFAAMEFQAYDESVGTYDRTIWILPRVPRADRGILNGFGDEKAMKYQEIFGCAKEFESLVNKKGVLDLKEKKYQEASEAFSKTVELSRRIDSNDQRVGSDGRPLNAIYEMNLASAYAQKKDDEKAIDIIKNILDRIDKPDLIRKRLIQDHDFDLIRENSKFKELVSPSSQND